MVDSSSGKLIAEEAARWSVVEHDGPVIVVRGPGGGEVVVAFEGDRWNCSECGSQSGNVTMKCAHIVAAARSMPLALALEIASKVSKPLSGGALNTAAKRAAVAATAAILAAGADKRAARVAEHDAAYRSHVSSVTVRQMTDADRAKLEARRAAKYRRMGRPDPDKPMKNW